MKLTCTLSKTLEALDERLERLNQSIKDAHEEAMECKAEMNEVKRLIKDLHQKANQSTT